MFNEEKKENAGERRRRVSNTRQKKANSEAPMMRYAKIERRRTWGEKTKSKVRKTNKKQYER